MAAGRFYSLRLMRRIRELERTILLIHQIELRLGFSQAPVADMIPMLASDPELTPLRYLVGCAEKLRENLPFPQAWREAVGQEAGRTALNREDLELLLSFGRGLGTTDLAGQEKLCDMHARMFAQQLEAARGQYQSRGKLGTVLGAAAGAVAVIFFI